MKLKEKLLAALHSALNVKGAMVGLVLLLLILGFFGGKKSENPILPTNGQSVSVDKEQSQNINGLNIKENKYVYSYDDDDSVVTMYLTVSKGNDAENTNHTWSEINGYSIFDYQRMGVERYKIEGLLQIGDEKGPVAGQVGYGLEIPNATVQIRGNTTTTMAQKSYKIELKDNAGMWRDQRTIALNKHVFDGLRFRNKLCYDLIKDLPGMIGMRTQFVHLYVKDKTKTTPDTAFIDYGLYTQVEQPNSRYLRNHGLDTGGQFYKANFFEFYRYDDVIKLKTDPAYDKVAFEQLLEIKGSDDHAKLIQMLTDLNDYTKPIEQVFEKYFDADNYFTWLAFNILMGNADTTSRNFYIYSPLNSNKWYFIAWDCDAALFTEEDHLLHPQDAAQDQGYEIGISNYWGTLLHNRVLREEKYRKMLDDKINELRVYMSHDKINAMENGYMTVIKKYVYSMPDAMYARLTSEEYDKIALTLVGEIDKNYQLYLDNLKQPMPFFLGIPEQKDNKINFGWDVAYSFTGKKITYTFELAKDYTFKQVIYKQEGLEFPSITLDKLSPGQYFFRVHATDEDGQSQVAMSYYVSADSIKYYGVQCFYISNTGEVVSSAT